MAALMWRRLREYWNPGRVALAVTVGPALVVPVLVLGWFVAAAVWP